ncbi:potassium channel family protein [Algoriphagus pacificus]|uniref:Two pore domain potassium channel family protein n=1 Tax=Algoriphagus pacificus TaxID=2811234 RepID=A0ABS3CK48_9BACT|nr:potassium channel family protein [Algoriphagus pacificus]MBN7816541.1 two pore domain potassium channel family protein [Algoriphagus pacificus]
MIDQAARKTKPVRRVFKHFTDYWLTDASFGVLLLILVFTVFVLPILIEYENVHFIFVNTVFLFMFFTGIWSSRERFLVFLTSGLFFTQLGLRLLRFSELDFEFYLSERIVGILNMLVFIFLNIRLLFRDREVNIYRIIGAINVYLLVAILGAFLFEIIHLITGSGIAGVGDLQGIDEDYAQYIYFSLVSLTTVGFGDLYPTQIMAKMLSVFLSTIGILYPAVVIARLVGTSKN